MIDGGLGSPVPVETLEDLNVDLAIGIGVGVESEDSQSIRVAQRFLDSKFGADLHRRLHDSVHRNPFAQLGRALAYTANLGVLRLNWVIICMCKPNHRLAGYTFIRQS